MQKGYNPDEAQKCIELNIKLKEGYEGLWKTSVNNDNFKIIVDKDEDENYYIVIRGTKFTKFSNIFGDIQVFSDNDFPFPFLTHLDPRISTGILNEFFELVDQLRVFLSYLPDNTNIYITGHSQGGAACSILHLWLHSLAPDKFNIKTYTFAAPSIGNHDFSTLVEEIAEYGFYRIVNPLDIVTYAYADLPSVVKHRIPTKVPLRLRIIYRIFSFLLKLFKRKFSPIGETIFLSEKLKDSCKRSFFLSKLFYFDCQVVIQHMATHYLTLLKQDEIREKNTTTQSRYIPAEAHHAISLCIAMDMGDEQFDHVFETYNERFQFMVEKNDSDGNVYIVLRSRYTPDAKQLSPKFSISDAENTLHIPRNLDPKVSVSILDELKRLSGPLMEYQNTFPEDTNFILTGHGKGGSACSIAQIWLNDNLLKKHSFKTYAFGSPVIGNEDFATLVDSSNDVTPFYNIQNPKDRYTYDNRDASYLIKNDIPIPAPFVNKVTNFFSSIPLAFYGQRFTDVGIPIMLPTLPIHSCDELFESDRLKYRCVVQAQHTARHYKKLIELQINDNKKQG